MVLYQNKKISWKWIVIRLENYEKNVFFHVRRAPNNHWLRKPRFFAHINLFFFSFWRDNSNLKFGVGFGKRQYSLIFHS